MIKVINILKKICMPFMSIAIIFTCITVPAYADTGTFDIKVTIPDDIRSSLSGNEEFLITYETEDGYTDSFTVDALDYETAKTVSLEEGFYFVTEISCLNDNNDTVYDAGYSCSDLFVSSNDDIDRTPLNIAIGWEAMKDIIDDEGASVAVNYNPPELYGNLVLGDVDRTYDSAPEDQSEQAREEGEAGLEAYWAQQEEKEAQKMSAGTEEESAIAPSTSESSVADNTDSSGQEAVVEYRDVTEVDDEEEDNSEGIKSTAVSLGIKLAICAAVLVVGLLIIYMFHRRGRI